jgi:5-formaminoimidazole-4-carboxamide-1-(beta)-D-ribofuranosyl 5'-monophosphate synthetase
MRTIFVPNRSFAVYVPYDGIERDFLVPVFGNRYLLRAEERHSERNQYFLLERAAIRTPKRFSRYDEIDRLVIVKVPEAERRYERGFFLATSPSDFEKKSAKLLEKGLISADSLNVATIEEFVVGAHFNFNFFFSPLSEELELLGVDTRRQTNLDGILRLPAGEQLAIAEHETVKTIEVGHFASTVRESLLDQAFDLGDRFVRTVKGEFPPGIIGPFALQCVITPGPPREEIVVFDASLRMPGSPGSKFTPYSEYLWRRPTSFGRRIAMELRRAVRESRLAEVVT